MRPSADIAAGRTTPGGNALVLKTLVSSICGSDLHGFRARDGSGSDSAAGHPDREPTDVIGHESVGVVTESRDDRYPVGTRVLHMPVVENGRTFAEYQATTGDFVVPVPDALTDEQAVFGQQLGTVLWSLKHYLPTGRVPETAVITGGGPAGLMFAQVLLAQGTRTIILSEPVPWRRDLAAYFGAIAIEPGALRATVAGHTSGAGVGLAVEASGSADARQQCLESVAKEGVVGFFGIPNEHESRIDLDLELAFDRNLTLSVVQNAQLEPGLVSFREALRMIGAAEIDVDSLISHRLPLARLAEAFEIASSISDGAVKVVVEIPGTPGSGNV